MISIWLSLLTLAVSFPVSQGEPIYVTGGTAPIAKQAHKDIENGYTREGQTPTPETCYESKNKGNQKAILQIPLAEVTKVELLSVEDDEVNIAAGTVVYVCTNGEDDCNQCPASYSTPKPVWLSHDCLKGTRGNTIVVYNAVNQTIFCEVKISGRMAVSVLDGTAATPWSSSDDIQFGYTKEGETLSPDTCYHSKDKENNKAVLQIPLSKVTKVELLNRIHSHASRTEGQNVSVCTEGQQGCKQCSASFSSAENGAWLPYDCPENTAGSEIVVSHDTFYTVFCEIWITGHSASLYVTGATAATPWSSREDIEHGYSKEGTNLTPDTCYHSKSTIDQKVILEIPLADVIKVELLNRNQNAADKTKGQVVFVCIDGTEDCEQCPASYSEAGNGAWLPYDCPQSTKGNTILIYHSSYYTIFCEVRVAGTRASLFVIEGSGATGWDGNTLIENGYSKEGAKLTPDTCYHSKNKGNQEVILQIPLSEVTKVELLNRDSYASETKGQLVYVCTDGVGCKQCSASYSEAGEGAWLPYDCPENTVGNKIAVNHWNYYTIFCEIWINGYKLL